MELSFPTDHPGVPEMLELIQTLYKILQDSELPKQKQQNAEKDE